MDLIHGSTDRKEATTTGVASEPAGALDLEQLILNDHNKVRHLFAEYKKANTQEVKQQLVYHVIRELSMHSSKEEEVVYPALSKAFGDQDAAHLRAEHQKLKDLLATIGPMDMYKQEAEIDKLMSELEGVFTHHIKDEEENEIPKLLKAPGMDGFELGRQFENAAKHAVTRPHNWAPDKAPLNYITNRMTAPLDAAADAIRFAGHVPDVPATGTTGSHV